MKVIALRHCVAGLIWCCLLGPAVAVNTTAIVQTTEKFVEDVQSKMIDTVVVNANNLDLIVTWLSASPVRVEGDRKTIKRILGRPRPILDVGWLVSAAAQNFPMAEISMTSVEFVNSSAVLKLEG